MQGQQAAASGSGSGGILRNRNVLIGVIVVGSIAIIAGIWLLVSSLMGGGQSTAAPVDATAVPSAGVDGGVDMGTAPAGGPGLSPGMSGGAPGMPGGSPLMPGMPGAAAVPAAGGAPSAGGTPGADTPPVRRGPGVPVRTNPFGMNTELRNIYASREVPQGPGFTADRELAMGHALWQELEAENPDRETPGPTVSDSGEDEGPPIPQMRVAAIQRGAIVSAIVQIGSEYFQVTPGKIIPENAPVYRVEQIESDRLVLTRRWELGGKKGVQRIEVTLQSGANTGTSTPGAPGGPGMFPGGPGGNMPGGGAANGPGGPAGFPRGGPAGFPRGGFPGGRGVGGR